MRTNEVLVVGCGLSGAVVARELAGAGKHVTIWERRNHIGGNMFDYIDEHGVLVQKYGPHVFHTQHKHLVEYIKSFTEWNDFQLVCGAKIDGVFTPTPFNFQTIDDFYEIDVAQDLKTRIKGVFAQRETATVVEVLQCQDSLVRGYAEFLFEKDYSLYTAKQWGLAPEQIDPSILKRVPLRLSYKNGYFEDEFQLMPKVSFTEFFNRLLDHPNINIKLGVDALDHLHIDENNNRILCDGRAVDFPVIYTGALDALFKRSKGSLPYRSLRFEWKHEEKESFQPMPVVAYPQAEGFTRISEFKKLPVQKVEGTTYAIEYPMQYVPNSQTEPYYPVLTEDSQKLYRKYAEKAARVANLYCCGRLADFKYYNMDQALDNALQLSKRVKL